MLNQDTGTVSPGETWIYGHFSNIKNAFWTATFSREGHQPKTGLLSSVVKSQSIQKCKIVVGDEWAFFTRRLLLEELGYDTELTSSKFPLCIYNNGNFYKLFANSTQLFSKPISVLHFKELVGRQPLRNHLNVIIGDGLLTQVEKMTLFFFILGQSKFQEMSSSWIFLVPPQHVTEG